MIKKNVKETVFEYDADGKVVRKTVTVTNETDDNHYAPCYTSLGTGTFITPATSVSENV